MSPPSPAELNFLKEEIAITEAIWESLIDQKGAAEARAKVAGDLRQLKEKLRTMQPIQPLPDWGQSAGYNVQNVNNQRPGSNEGSTHSNNSYAFSSHNLMPPPNQTELPSRKRHADFGDSVEWQVKSRRTTPTPRTHSRADSVDSSTSDYSDDSLLKDLLGGDWREESRNNKAYLRDLEARKLQEEEDAKFARELQEKWERENITTPVSRPVPTSTTSTTQSFMRPDGSWRKPTSELTSGVLKSQQEYSGSSTPWTPNDSDSSGFEEISAEDWSSRFQKSTPSRHNMPGGFPGSYTNPYASTSGSSVYGHNNAGNAFDFLSSAAGNLSYSFLPGLGQYGQSTGGPNIYGTYNSPYDLDAMPGSFFPSTNHGYADPEQTQEEIKNLLKHIRPDEELTEEQLREVQPEGLKIDLMPHQRKGFAWMKTMEAGTNKGGILADDMGLGKTVQALSLILARPPEDGAQRPTLVVAPVALMQQWEREIKKFVKRSHQLEVLILHQENRNKPWSFIKQYDIVLTTYGTLASEMKRKLAWDKHVEIVPDAKPKPQQECPVLGERSRFHRVILDEAQNIKNRNTKAAVAACRINADYRWCLSGTPMQNNVDEIYSLIKFCRIRPYHDHEKFARDIGRPLKKFSPAGRDQAMERLQAVLRAILLRRTKKSEIDGQPIVRLPEKHTVEERAIFTKDELDFYKALETQSQIQFNKFLKEGSVGRHYSHALVLLLRLRQCCCSAQLVTNAPDFMTSGVMEGVDYIENAKMLPQDVLRRLNESDAFECPICMDAVENPVIFNPCGHSLCEECLTAMTEKALEDASGKLSCPHCRGEIDIKLVTNHESYLRVHHPGREGVKPLKEESEDDEAEEDDSDSDSDDDDDDDLDDGSDDGEDLKDFIVADDDDDAIEYDSDASGMGKSAFTHLMPPKNPGKDASRTDRQKKSKKSKTRKTKGKGKGKEKKKLTTLADLRREGLKNKAAKKKYLKRLAKGWLPSAKIEKTVELLQEIKNRGEGEKTIVFSSFTSFLDLVEVPLSRDEELSNYVRYDGSMKTQDRTDAVVRFTDDARCKVMLVSLKAGNAGLNLTAANHVIILDPFWNPFVEAQAADRCYRIGQTREVFIHRILIGDESDAGQEPDPEKDFTVEDRILKLQEKKRLLVETALDEKAASNFGRLSTRDLGYLFGVNSMS